MEAKSGKLTITVNYRDVSDSTIEKFNKLCNSARMVAVADILLKSNVKEINLGNFLEEENCKSFFQDGTLEIRETVTVKDATSFAKAYKLAEKFKKKMQLARNYTVECENGYVTFNNVAYVDTNTNKVYLSAGTKSKPELLELISNKKVEDVSSILQHFPVV